MMKNNMRENLKELPIVSVHLEVDNCLLSEKPILKPMEAIELVADHIYDSAKENAVAIFLDEDLFPICIASVGSGNTQNVLFSARDIVQTALLCNATYVTIIHNHPGLSSDKTRCKPSLEDVLVTNSILQACSIVEVKLYDSIITTTHKKNIFSEAEAVYYSIREHSLKGLRRKFRIKDDVLPISEDELIWERDENYYTKDGKVANQQKESSGISYKYVDRQTGEMSEYKNT